MVRRSSIRLVAELGTALLLVLLPLPVPALLPLLILASISLAARGGSFGELGLSVEGAASRLVLGLCLGAAVASALHVVTGPASSDIMLLRGNRRVLVSGLLLAAASGVATEMVFRGYLIGSMHQEWGQRGASLGVLLGALLSALALQPETLVAGLGALILALGYGLFYLAGGRNLVLPIAVHVAVDAHGLVVEFL